MLKAKNPGTNFNTVAPQPELKYKAEFEHPPWVTEVQVAPVLFVDVAAVLTSVDKGATNELPSKIAIKPPIKFAIIVYEI